MRERNKLSELWLTNNNEFKNGIEYRLVSQNLSKPIFIEDHPHSAFIFHWWSSSSLPFIKGQSHLGLYTTHGCLQMQFVSQQISSLIKGCIPLMVVFHQKLSSICGSLSSWYIFWNALNVGTVPTFKLLNVGTVLTFKMHNVGPVPTYKSTT